MQFPYHTILPHVANLWKKSTNDWIVHLFGDFLMVFANTGVAKRGATGICTLTQAQKAHLPSHNNNDHWILFPQGPDQS